MKKKTHAILLALSLSFLLAAPGVSAHHVKRHHHQHRHHGTTHKVVSVVAPIAVGAAFGPAGSIGYQGFKHRRAIKHRLIGHRHSAGHHQRHRA